MALDKSYGSFEHNLYEMIQDSQLDYPKNKVDEIDIIEMIYAFKLTKDESIKYMKKFLKNYPFNGNVVAIEHNKKLPAGYYENILAKVEPLIEKLAKSFGGFEYKGHFDIRTLLSKKQKEE
jgi:hypothetical protein